MFTQGFKKTCVIVLKSFFNQVLGLDGSNFQLAQLIRRKSEDFFYNR